MLIRLWNAFASNNSGSYTIVGSFPSAELASEIARELSVLMQEHTAWLESSVGEASSLSGNVEGSPLSRFLTLHGINPGASIHYEWPQYSDDDTPRVFAVETKVVIHHEYTITLPREFGEYFYIKGGRVEQELNHAHNSIISTCELWIPWSEREGINIGEKIVSFIEDLCEPGGEFIRQSTSATRFSPSWRAGDGLNRADLTICAVFDDLPAGFDSVNTTARKYGFKTYVRVSEAFDDNEDPMAFLRPCMPPLQRGRSSITLDNKGFVPAEVVKVLESVLKVDRQHARQILDSAPVEIMSDIFPEEAEEAAARLRKAGAAVSIQPVD